MINKKEEWRKIQGFDGYEVSNTNKVRSIDRIAYTFKGGKYIRKGKELKPGINPNTGYAYVVLCKNGKTFIQHIHRIVAFAFPEICGEWFPGAVVNHKDFNRSNNVPENLEWVTIGYNFSYRKPKPLKKFVPKYSAFEPIKVTNVNNNEVHYFINRAECAEFLKMRSGAPLLHYYLKKGTLYKKEFLIEIINESDPNYWVIKTVNEPSEEQIETFGLTQYPNI